MRSLSLLFVAVASSANAQYFAEILPTPSGTGRAVAAGGGQMVGVAFGSGGGPALWDGPNHSYQVLNTNGFIGAEVNGVGGGKQVGYGIAGGHEHALLWSGAANPPINLHNTAFLGTIAYGTNGNKQVGAGGVVQGGNVSHAVLWHGSAQSAVNLHPAGYQNSEAYSVWGDVQVGSAAGGPTGGGAALWRGTAESMQLLPTPVTHTTGDAFAVHGNQAVGRIVDFAAVVWDIDKWTYTSLGSGFAVDTNGTNQVGYVGPAFEERALVWAGSEASRLDLHQFLPAGFTRSLARGIDENGNIVGYGSLSGVGTVPIVWKPVPEPSTVVAIGMGLLALLARRRFR